MVQIGWGCLSSEAIAFGLKMLGLRGGISDHLNEEDFTQYEGFSTWNLPWSWDLASNCSLTAYIEANAGLLKGGGDSALVGSIGPGLYLSAFKDRISILTGVNPTVISKHTFGDEDLGGHIQFTSDKLFQLAQVQVIIQFETPGVRVNDSGEGLFHGLATHIVGVLYMGKGGARLRAFETWTDKDGDKLIWELVEKIAKDLPPGSFSGTAKVFAATGKFIGYQGTMDWII